MKIPVSWLKEYVDVTMPPQALAEMITSAGMEVEKIDYIGIDGAELVWDRDLVLLGQIIKVEKHPDADTLVLASVDYGAEMPKIVVTGAPNLQPFVGQGNLSNQQLFSPIIFEGATYLNPYKDMKPTKLKGKALRGIYNDAMLCAEDEIGLGSDHDGIVIIKKETNSPDYVAGTPLQDVLGDAVIEVDIIPNIARTASIVGIAREVAALTGKQLRYPSYDVIMEGNPIDGLVEITTADPTLNPRFVGMIINNVEQKPSPYWMQHRLRLAGQRPINVVVDISNYVMLEMGQPNHTFDYDFLRKRAEKYDANGPIQLITRLAKEDEKMTTLDGVEHTLYPNNMMVTDPLGNLSLAGIMGGFDSEIQPETTNVLLEAAAWNFINIRHSQRQLNIHTEAGFRFSRGVHRSQAILGAKRAAHLLHTLAGGTVANGIIDYYPAEPEPIVIELDPTYVTRRSGLDISKAEIGELLKRLEFEVVDNGKTLSITVPDHRIDVEGQHDLLEEVCRMYGYDRIPSTVLAEVLPVQRGNKPFEQEAHIKDILVNFGLNEVITYRLTTADAEKRALANGSDDQPYVTLQNPSTVERVNMRHNLLASVLDIAATNTRFVDTIRIFEIGRTYVCDQQNSLPTEDTHLAIVLSGKREMASWQSSTEKMVDFYDLKGVVDQLFADLKVAATYEPVEHPTFRPGRTAKVIIHGKQVGTIGELHPLVVEQYEMRVEKEQAVLAADINIDTLLSTVPDSFKVEPLPIYPAVREDLAFVIDSEVAAADVEKTLQKAGGFLLKKITLFDVYEGDNLPAGKKSLAYHLTFQSPNKTLKDKDIQKLRKKLIGAATHQLGAKLRDS